ncbi:DNA polymerase III subunit delta [Oculatella sp. LEGE 06141]|uniref:DNA polymerase III subunit delta n=1 Tax=Oculatella sp. LEGE 06141 TaxID=1828648 RepID=UPI0018825676|nr:DNA polymerase III subunit delta [Oculatella sp. LEGE 06141]MBE9181348.1 DNA polymerase III subunit delta [Oculatella sp. LEGE 06141]
MPIYVYWGDDEFALNRAAIALRDRTIAAEWASFNYDKIPPEQPDGLTQGLNQAMTPPFGTGNRLVWIVETTVCQRCPEETLAELERTLPAIPDTSVLLLTTATKPDGRLKSTKLLQKHAEVKEFTSIPPWKTDLLMQQVRQAAQEVGVKLTPEAAQLLAESVGNDTRQLYSELEKLRLYAGSAQQPLPETVVATLVAAYSQNSLQLASAIRQGDTGKALTLIAELFNRNEPALRIVAVLVGQFRKWLWVKLMTESGERDDRTIAQAAEVNNPRQIYFLQQDVKPLPLHQLKRALSILLELEFGLKKGADEFSFLQTKVLELCHLFCRR